MDRIEIEKTYPQLVKVVNELKAKLETSPSNPLDVSLADDLIWGSSGSRSVRTYSANTASWIFCRPSINNYNLHISSVHVVNASVGTVFPVNLTVYNVTNSSIANHVSAVNGTFHARFPNATSIVVFYETISNGGVVSAESFSSND